MYIIQVFVTFLKAHVYQHQASSFLFCHIAVLKFSLLVVKYRSSNYYIFNYYIILFLAGWSFYIPLWRFLYCIRQWLPKAVARVRLSTLFNFVLLL